MSGIPVELCSIVFSYTTAKPYEEWSKENNILGEEPWYKLNIRVRNPRFLQAAILNSDSTYFSLVEQMYDRKNAI